MACFKNTTSYKTYVYKHFEFPCCDVYIAQRVIMYLISRFLSIIPSFLIVYEIVAKQMNIRPYPHLLMDDPSKEF